MTYRHAVIGLDGKLTVHEQDHALTLEEMQGAVGGYIELFMEDGQLGFYCDEEGKLNGAPANVLWGGDVIVGPVLIVRHQGEDVDSLTERDMERLGALYNPVTRRLRY